MEVTTQGNRLEKLKQVLQQLNPNVIGLQEVDDRETLELLFPPNEWNIVIDDDSGYKQDVAAVVRKEFHILNINHDMDADDPDFVFPCKSDDSLFPQRRDVLRLEIELPDKSDRFILLVHHAKSRYGGRAKTNSRRAQASTRLVEFLKPVIQSQKIVYVCDCNDSPDDQSSNILETGNPKSGFDMEEDQGKFLVNLTEPLYQKGHVSFGKKSNDLTPNKTRVDTIDKESRKRNYESREQDKNTGDILFDHIYVSHGMLKHFVQGSAKVFDCPEAVLGNDLNRASDHLPVFADFQFSTSSTKN